MCRASHKDTTLWLHVEKTTHRLSSNIKNILFGCWSWVGFNQGSYKFGTTPYQAQAFNYRYFLFPNVGREDGSLSESEYLQHGWSDEAFTHSSVWNQTLTPCTRSYSGHRQGVCRRRRTDRGRRRETFPEQTQPTVKGDGKVQHETTDRNPLNSIKNSRRGLIAPHK